MQVDGNYFIEIDGSQYSLKERTGMDGLFKLLE